MRTQQHSFDFQLKAVLLVIYVLYMANQLQKGGHFKLVKQFSKIDV